MSIIDFDVSNPRTPGATLRLLIILPPSSATHQDLSSDQSLSSIYLASVLYLVQGEASLHRVHPFTGAVLQINSSAHMFPSPLQVIVFLKKFLSLV